MQFQLVSETKDHFKNLTAIVRILQVLQLVSNQTERYPPFRCREK